MTSNKWRMKTKSKLLLFLMIASMLFPLVAQASQEEAHGATQEIQSLSAALGDINGDGRVDILDLQLLLRHISGSSLLTGAGQLWAADVDQNGDVDIRDLRLLLQFVSGRINDFGPVTPMVTFNLNSHRASMNITSKNLVYGQAFGELPVPVVSISPTQIGMRFIGWFTELGGGKRVTAETIVETRGHITLHGLWGCLVHFDRQRVSFSLEGGESFPAPPYVDASPHWGHWVVPVRVGFPYGDLPVPVRPGYTFEGWFTSRQGGNQITPDTIVPQELNTVFARWIRNPFTVTFNPNGGVVGETSRIITGNTYGELPLPTRDGHIFAGWFTSRTGAAARAESTNLLRTVDHTLYARWDRFSESNIVLTGGESRVISVVGVDGNTLGFNQLLIQIAEWRTASFTSSDGNPPANVVGNTITARNGVTGTMTLNAYLGDQRLPDWTIVVNVQ